MDFITDLAAYLNSSSLERERKSVDLLSEMSEHLQQAQTILLPSQVPSWAHTEIGVAFYRGVGIGGVYFDFFSLPDGCYGVVMAEPSAKGVEGVLYTAVLRGMVRTLCRLTTQPTSLITFLNDLIVRDTTNKIFWFSYLVLSPRTDKLHFISCGRSKLWQIRGNGTSAEKIQAENPPLGTKLFSEFEEVTLPWNVGDYLCLHTTTICSDSPEFEAAFDEKTFAESLVNSTGVNTQKHMEAILRKASASDRPQLERRLLCLLGIRRIVS